MEDNPENIDAEKSDSSLSVIYIDQASAQYNLIYKCPECKENPELHFRDNTITITCPNEHTNPITTENIKRIYANMLRYSKEEIPHFLVRDAKSLDDSIDACCRNNRDDLGKITMCFRHAVSNLARRVENMRIYSKLKEQNFRHTVNEYIDDPDGVGLSREDSIPNNNNNIVGESNLYETFIAQKEHLKEDKWTEEEKNYYDSLCDLIELIIDGYNCDKKQHLAIANVRDLSRMDAYLKDTLPAGFMERKSTADEGETSEEVGNSVVCSRRNLVVISIVSGAILAIAIIVVVVILANK